MPRDLDDLPNPLNPYSPPASPIQASKGEVSVPEFLLFFRWEKLRLLYNAVLGFETIGTLAFHPSKQPPVEVITWLILLAGLANLCFCLGPVLDGYAHWMGLRSRATSLSIFGLGTLFAMLLAGIALMNLDGPMFD
jgi:hypothetical protein